ncbi:MAG: hypothetical protein M9905_01000 [Rhizobiaceae bacterium]|nr:hypothetical protein [Rhizobiaceae bacterium]
MNDDTAPAVDLDEAEAAVDLPPICLRERYDALMQVIRNRHRARLRPGFPRCRRSITNSSRGGSPRAIRRQCAALALHLRQRSCAYEARLPAISPRSSAGEPSSR